MNRPATETWQPDRGNRLLALIFMTLGVTLASMTSLWLPSIAPNVAADLGIDASLIGYQVLAVYLGAMTTSLMAGGFTRRRTCQVSLAMFVLAISMIISGHLVLIALGSFTVGLGYGLANPPAASILTRIATPQNQALIFSIRFTGVPLGGVIAGLAGPQLALTYGWQASLAMPLGLIAISGLLMQPLRARWDQKRQADAPIWRPPLTDVRLAFQYPTVKWLCFTGLFLAAVQLSLTSFTVTVLVEDIGHDLVTAGIALSCIQVAGVVGRVTWGWLADRSQSPLAVMAVITAVIAAGDLRGLFRAWLHRHELERRLFQRVGQPRPDRPSLQHHRCGLVCHLQWSHSGTGRFRPVGANHRRLHQHLFHDRGLGGFGRRHPLVGRARQTSGRGATAGSPLTTAGKRDAFDMVTPGPDWRRLGGPHDPRGAPTTGRGGP